MGNWEWGFGVAEMGELTLEVPGSKAPTPPRAGSLERGDPLELWQLLQESTGNVVSGTGKSGAAGFSPN